MASPLSPEVSYEALARSWDFVGRLAETYNSITTLAQVRTGHKLMRHQGKTRPRDQGTDNVRWDIGHASCQSVFQG